MRRWSGEWTTLAYRDLITAPVSGIRYNTGRSQIKGLPTLTPKGDLAMIDVTKTAAQELQALAAATERPQNQVLRIFFKGYG
jgi:hypothetical protein